jgi:hypothetical protein
MKSLASVITAPFKLIRNKIFFLIFLNGFLLALLVYFFIEDNYESQIFKALATQVRQTSKSNNIDSILSQSVQLTHNLEQFRQSVFGDKEVRTFKSELIRPVTFDLMTGSGACGSYSFVLSRLLSEMDIDTRLAQMKVDGKYGGHIIVEAKSGDKWIALDASYNMIFRKPNGEFASFQDIKGNWDSYKNQVPADYDLSYNYADVRYTNWEKIPVVMPMIKSMMNVTMGKKAADEYSIRSLFIKKFSFLFKATLFLYLLFALWLFRLFRRQSAEIEKFRLSLLFPKKSIAKSEPAHVAA